MHHIVCWNMYLWHSCYKLQLHFVWVNTSMLQQKQQQWIRPKEWRSNYNIFMLCYCHKIFPKINLNIFELFSVKWEQTQINNFGWHNDIFSGENLSKQKILLLLLEFEREMQTSEKVLQKIWEEIYIIHFHPK